MQCLLAHRRIAGEPALGGHGDTVLDGWRAKYSELCGQVVRQVLDYEGVGTQGKVPSMLLTGAHRNDQPPVAAERLGDLVWAHLFDAARCGRLGCGVSHR